MLPRFGLLLLLPTACAAPEDRAAAALNEALGSSRASLTVTGAAIPAAAAPEPISARLAVVGTAPRRRIGPAPQSATQLLGAAPDALRRWLGEPSLRRAEGGAEVWLYVAADCALDLVLYRDRGNLAVAHAAARAQGTATATEAACLDAIAGAPPPTAAGLETGGG